MDWKQISTVHSRWLPDKSYAWYLFPDRNRAGTPSLNASICKHTIWFSQELTRGFKHCFLILLYHCFLILFCIFFFFLLLKVYFPNCQRKRTQKEFKWGHSKLIYPFSFPMAYLWTDCDRGPDTESWFMISLASDVLPCCHCVQRDCASQKWSMSIALGRSGPKLRLPENFLNYSALTITFWTLLKELSLLSLLPSPLDNLNHELLSLFTCTNKKQSTNLYVGIHCVREHAWERLTLDKGAFTVNFLQAFFSA